MEINTQIIHELLKTKSDDGSFSGVVLVRQQCTNKVEYACGMADRSNSIPSTLSTRFATASASKLLTSLAVCQLVEKRKLAFDMKIHECLGRQLGNISADVTLHHLLTHSSGIPDYTDDRRKGDRESVWNNVPVYAVQSASDYLRLFVEKPMKFRPGERYLYCNSGYVLLGLAVEKATGMSFCDYVAENILGPAGMSESGYFESDRLPQGTARGYIGKPGDWRTNVFSLVPKGGPDGGAYTTARDLMRFWDALTGYKLLSEELTQKMLSPQIEDGNTGEWFYGYGLWANIQDGSTVKFSCIGEDPGVSVRLFVYPKHGVRIAVLSNLSETAASLADQIQDLIFPAGTFKLGDPSTLLSCGAGGGSCGAAPRCGG
ncbi:hypothetical protein BE08_14220 [Sorangium cellulosum]|uniref:Beta-lactamase-related domain-containing protein n=1 Tax=Sorangium cellulosum TaxID=56 RepID=A0A150PMP4_SORCE|nr:hypothetical protein BE08_14220 [Sorangium cellulosum]